MAQYTHNAEWHKLYAHLWLLYSNLQAAQKYGIWGVFNRSSGESRHTIFLIYIYSIYIFENYLRLFQELQFGTVFLASNLAT